MALDEIIARIEALKERARTAYDRGFAAGVAKRDEDVAADYNAGQQDACAQLLDLLPPVDNEPAQDGEHDVSKAGESILRGAREALAYVEGEVGECVTHVPETVPTTQTQAVLELVIRRAAQGLGTYRSDIKAAHAGNMNLIHRLRDRGLVEQDATGAYYPAGYSAAQHESRAERHG